MKYKIKQNTVPGSLSANILTLNSELHPLIFKSSRKQNVLPSRLDTSQKVCHSGQQDHPTFCYSIRKTKDHEKSIEYYYPYPDLFPGRTFRQLFSG